MASTPQGSGSGSGRPFNTTTIIDRPHVRITKTTIEPRAVIPAHPHAEDFVVYPLEDYNIKRVYHKDGKPYRTVRMTGRTGQPYKVKGTAPGVTISIENDSDKPVHFEKTVQRPPPRS